MSRSEPRDPRIAPKEMIITRFKSAQQKKKQQEQFGLSIQPAKKPPQPPQNLKLPQTITKVTQNVPKVTQTATKLPQTVTKVTQNISKVQSVKTPDTVQKSKSKKAKGESSVSKPSSPILIEDDSPEYYPEKLKRAPGSRKVFMKPKQKSTMVARTNKRKFNTPKRGVKSPLPRSPKHTFSQEECPVYSELSMEEVIRIVEENDSLDDDDLMEILTCPSPVWWEEPPDEMYIEEAICSRKPEENATGKKKSPIRERCLNTLRNSSKLGKKIKTQVSDIPAKPATAPESNIPDKSAKIATEKPVEVKKDEKFIKKSKKLENVLGNIKNKASKDTDVISKSIKQELITNEEKSQVETSENEAVLAEAVKSNDVPSLVETKKDVPKTVENVNKTTEPVINVKKEVERAKKKKLSESTEDSFGDLNCRNQEMLLDLENMDIPVQESAASPDCMIIIDDNTSKVIDLDDDDKEHQDDKNTDKKATGVGNESDANNDIKADENPSTNIDNQTKLHSETAREIDAESLVPKNMPPLTKRPKINNTAFASPNSYKSISDDVTESSSVSNTDGMDTISDTNIKYIMDDDLDEVMDNNKIDNIKDSNQGTNDPKINVKDEKFELNELTILSDTNDPKSKDAYITVYKIMSNEESVIKPTNKFKDIPEYSSYVENLIQVETKQEFIDESLENEIQELPVDAKGQLNSFFKKCKYANRKRKRVDPKDKIVDDTECKSPKKSITVVQEDNVKLCLKCSAIFDTEECNFCLKSQKESKDVDKSYMCDKCDYVGESTSNVIVHLEEHMRSADEGKT
ncbi:uncharacterized protein LOC135085484 [Ostrinia nubilalis]|uniref:uncharacterized protein LOC135085484 n=1 Tax=Ostrinia nubilalis TaxID=29057 RepID=UPI0030826915